MSFEDLQISLPLTELKRMIPLRKSGGILPLIPKFPGFQPWGRWPGILVRLLMPL